MYEGYEQAVLERARQLQWQQAQRTEPPPPPPPPPPTTQYYRTGKKTVPFYNGQNSAGQWKKRAPFKPPVDPSQYYCELCNISCLGTLCVWIDKALFARLNLFSSR